MEVVNIVVSVVAIVLSGVAILLSFGAKRNLEKAREIMSEMEKKVEDIKKAVEGQIQEAWKIGMDKIKGETKIPDVSEIQKVGTLIKMLKDAGMEKEIKDVIRSGLKSK